MKIREITLTENVAPKLSINGDIFELCLSDAEIMSITSDISKRYTGMAQNGAGKDEIIAAVKEVSETIDKILGEGAVAKIAKGKPVSIVTAIKWLNVIASEAMAVYAEEMASLYE